MFRSERQNSTVHLTGTATNELDARISERLLFPLLFYFLIR